MFPVHLVLIGHVLLQSALLQPLPSAQMCGGMQASECAASAILHTFGSCRRATGSYGS